MTNEFIQCGNYYIGKTPRGAEFLFDSDDYDIVSQHYWKKHNDSIFTVCDGTIKSMANLLTNGQNVRYKNGDPFDNRRENIVDCRGYSKRITYNGYYAIYMPEHPMAYSNGCVYEHILVAEEMLGRYLVDDECVHHKDRNRKNNSPDNLMVFKTQADHARYHNGGKAILLPDGTYISHYEHVEVEKDNNKDSVKEEKKGKPRIRKTIYKNVCSKCGKPMTSKAKLCFDCSKIASRKVERPSKEELDEMIHSMPFVKIAEKYGVSDKAITKWCKSYGLPYRRKDIRAENN